MFPNEFDGEILSAQVTSVICMETFWKEFLKMQGHLTITGKFPIFYMHDKICCYKPII